MKMEILISDQALIDFEEILEYVSDQFGRQSAQRLETKTDDLLQNLTVWPEAHRMIYPKQAVRRAVVHPRVVMFYKVYFERDIILIVRFKNTYQNYSPRDIL